MIKKSFVVGFRRIRQHTGLVLFLFGIDLILAFLLGNLLYSAFLDVTATSGYSRLLAGGFDAVLMSSVLKETRPVLLAAARQLLLVVPLYITIRCVVMTGVTYALRDSGARTIWHGIGYYGGRGALLALAMVGPVLVLGITTGLSIALLASVFEGEVASYWLIAAVVPTLLVLVFAFVDLVHDYARVELVTDRGGVFRSLWGGLVWAFRRPGSWLIYGGWLAPALVLSAVPLLFDASSTAASSGAIWGLFFLQQVVFLFRSAVTVGWMGSQVYYYESIRMAETPLIAEEPVLIVPDPAGPDAVSLA